MSAVLTDPFLETPDADPDEIEVRDTRWALPEKPCELVGKLKKTKKVDLNPLQRRWFERNGYTYARVETTNGFGAVTVDMWSCWDYLAVRPPQDGEPGSEPTPARIVLVQVTTASNAAARLKKILAAPETAVWLRSGGHCEIHAWKQPGGPGTRWENVVRPVTLETA